MTLCVCVCATSTMEVDILSAPSQDCSFCLLQLPLTAHRQRRTEYCFSFENYVFFRYRYVISMLVACFFSSPAAHSCRCSTPSSTAFSSGYGYMIFSCIQPVGSYGFEMHFELFICLFSIVCCQKFEWKVVSSSIETRKFSHKMTHTLTFPLFVGSKRETFAGHCIALVGCSSPALKTEK